jgi:hypothetical protein
MTIDLPIELGAEVYGIFFDTANDPKIELVRVRGVLIISDGIYVVGYDGSELKLGHDAFIVHEDALYHAEQIAEAKKSRRRIPLYDMKGD